MFAWQPQYQAATKLSWSSLSFIRGRNGTRLQAEEIRQPEIRNPRRTRNFARCQCRHGRVLHSHGYFGDVTAAGNRRADDSIEAREGGPEARRRDPTSHAKDEGGLRAL